ncbi:ATP-grasp fold amidoligase family protein [Burkholderia ubonensis]|nr:ATP-grasp fold amidoligase family protein [Burkholderia ubonensis]
MTSITDDDAKPVSRDVVDDREATRLRLSTRTSWRSEKSMAVGQGLPRDMTQKMGRTWAYETADGLLRRAKPFMPDSLYLWLSHRKRVGRFPNLVRPATLNEHLLHRCLHPEPRWSVLADKLAVREFVKDRIGEQYLIPLIAAPEAFTKEIFDSLPSAFVMKANHGCAFVEIVRDKAKTSFEDLRQLAQTWLATNFYLVSRERHYRSIKPRIYFEALLLDRAGNIPADLKLNMFGDGADGPIIFTAVIADRFGHPHADFFDVNWRQLDLALGNYPRSETPPPQPANWAEIVRVARRLAEGLGYVRVDIYAPDGQVYFGELTFTPGAGVFPFYPDRYDYEWGRLFTNMNAAAPARGRGAMPDHE